jgi:FMN phosphatase YigB (HAD superfamily)
MVLEVKWIGFDFGQCLMDTGGMRNHLLIGDACKELNEPHLMDMRIHRYRVLKEKYESYSIVKEAHRDEIASYVFDNREGANEVFEKVEQEHLRMGVGLEDALSYLTNQGIELSVVSELKKTLGAVGTDVISRFLEKRRLTTYFRYIITPQGKVDLGNGSIDSRYKGKTKEKGTLFDELALELRSRGIDVTEAAMVGDKLWTDISPAKRRGFKTVQYTGYVDMGPSEDADFRISDFRELKRFVRKKL